MLQYLKLVNVGPAPTMEIEFAPRMTFLVGDNGLGKTFLLDTCWWVLTRTWARNPAVPPNGTIGAEMHGRIAGRGNTPAEPVFKYNRERRDWIPNRGRPAKPALVVYAQVDGGYAVWDSVRNESDAAGDVGGDTLSPFRFGPDEVWDGYPRATVPKVCNGLILDWASWQRERSEPYDALVSVLERLSPSDSEKLVPGPLTRIAIKDARDHPTIRMPYGHDVPLVHAAAGIRRVVALAYLLVWAWFEHLRACELTGRQQASEVLFLVDEVEAHLHPQWQRRIVPALLGVMHALRPSKPVETQLVLATHAPLVMASVEPLFDEDRDRVYHLLLADSTVRLEEEPWAKQGDATNWLVSDAFGLRQARSLEAEAAIDAADRFMRGETGALPENMKTEEAIDQELRRVLAGHDEYWPMWVVWVRDQARARR